MGFVNSVDFYFSFFVCFRVVFLGYLHGRMVIVLLLNFDCFTVGYLFTCGGCLGCWAVYWFAFCWW